MYMICSRRGSNLEDAKKAAFSAKALGLSIGMKTRFRHGDEPSFPANGGRDHLLLSDYWKRRAIPIGRNALLHKMEYSGRDIIYIMHLTAIILRHGSYVGAGGKVKPFKSMVATAFGVFSMHHKSAVLRRVHH
jgi:hypothetical protein